MTKSQMDVAKARNARWLNTKINEAFYQLEKGILEKRKYPTTKIP